MRSLLRSLVFVICIVFVCEVSLAAESYESTTLAKEHFAQHQFIEGKSVLINRLRTPGLTNTERSAILGIMGDFFCDYVGDFRSGLSYYQRAQKSHLDNADFKKDRIEYILSCREKYADIDKLVFEVSNKPNWLVNEPGIAAKTDTLKQVIVSSPNYYRMAELYYCLAIYNAGESKDRKALDYFKQAESLKPAMGYFIPLHGHYKTVHDRLIRSVVTISTTSVFTFMFILSAALFYAAKPWHWLTLKNIGGFIILLVLLCLSVLAVGRLLATSYMNSESTQQMISAGEKYLFTSLDGPGFDIYATFLMYMAAAFFLTYVFALGASALIRKKSVAVVLNSIAGTLIMASLVCIFYMRNCDMKTLDPPNVSPGAFLSTSNALLFTVDGIEPFILTEPENFPNPGVSHNTNPPLEDWAREHCPFDNKDESGGQ